ncbi:MAG: Hpt domain-containing protein [Bdellovibrionota bacterium]
MTPIFRPEALVELHQLEKDGASGLVKSLFDDYTANAPISVKAIEAAYSLQDYKQVEFTAHSLKSSSKALGLEKMAELCKEIEYAADANQFATDAITSLAKQNTLALEALSQYAATKLL